MIMEPFFEQMSGFCWCCCLWMW